MVTAVTSLTGNGLKDWLIQRVTAGYLMVYIAAWFGCFFCHPHMDYNQWHVLLTSTWVQITTVLALFAILLHAWIGIWTVTTDYIQAVTLRVPIQMAVLLILIAEFIWGIKSLWGQ